MKLALAAVLLTFTFSAPVLANDSRDPMEAVMKQLAITLKNNKVAPAVVSDVTSGGAEQFAAEWLRKMQGEVIGRELGEAYRHENASSVESRTILPERAPIAKIEFRNGEVDWAALEEIQPKVRSYVTFSRPAFDAHGTIAAVRADVVARDGKRFTVLSVVERQADGRWTFVRAAQGGTESMHSADAHAHYPEEASLYH
jgi:hypothetical protein